MIRVEEALEKILQSVAPLGLEKVGILDAPGRVIGEDIQSGRDVPPGDRSAMDGYALRSADTRGASPERPVRLSVATEVAAGAVLDTTIGPGQAARIMTGAPIPEGADAVVRMEETRQEGTAVSIFAEARPGQDIRRAGQDVRRGEPVVSRGETVRAAAVGMLAAIGRAFVLVHRRPMIAVVATGSELAEIEEPPSPWKIVGSNSYSLAALIRECGAIPLRIGIAKDIREDLAVKFGAALRADLIVSSGGASAGDYDLVREILKGPGNRLDFWQVEMMPGRPVAFGALQGVPLVALPGNPSASLVCFEQFVRPAVLKMMGRKNIFRQTVPARIGKRVEKKRGFRQFIWSEIRPDQEGYRVVPTANPESGLFQSIARANALIVMPEEVMAVEVDETVMVQLLDDSLLRTAEPGY